MKTRIISFSNHKGGQSKTSSTVSVGSNLSRRGYKVLLIDLDAQANLTNSLLEGNHEENLYTAMTGRSKLPILPVSETLYVVPASLELAMLDLELASAIARERILADLLEPIKDMFDFIFHIHLNSKLAALYDIATEDFHLAFNSFSFVFICIPII